jgi:hypothetical protein
MTESKVSVSLPSLDNSSYVLFDTRMHFVSMVYHIDLIEVIYNSRTSIRPVKSRDTDEILKAISRIQKDVAEIKGQLVKDQVVQQKWENLREFDKEERAYIDYIEKHPGDIKQQIFNAFDEGYNGIRKSRKPSNTIVKRLEELKVFETLPHPENRQMKRVYLNKSSMLLQLDAYLNRLHSKFIETIQSFINKLGHRNEFSPEQVDDILNICYPIFASYHQVVSMLFLHALEDWPKATNNPYLLRRLYNILFFKLMEFQKQMRNVLEDGGIAYRDNLVYSAWRLGPEQMLQGIAASQKYDLQRQMESVYDVIWDMSYTDFPSVKLFFETNLGERGELSKTNERPSNWRQPFKKWYDAQATNLAKKDLRKEPKDSIPS